MLSTTVAVGRRDERNSYRKHFESLGLGPSVKFEEHYPAYEYGQTLRASSATGKFEDIEPEVKARWEAKNPGTWERVRDSIKYAFAKKS